MTIGYYAAAGHGDSVDVQCQDCPPPHTLTVPVYCIGPDNTIHIDHEYLAEHHAMHERERHGLDHQ